MTLAIRALCRQSTPLNGVEWSTIFKTGWKTQLDCTIHRWLYMVVVIWS